MTRTFKTCSRCGKTKPAELFRASWCKQCHVDSTREWRRERKNHQDAEKQVKRGHYADPEQWARNVCKHIAEHAERSIKRFERHTGKEAPPHLTEILGLANQLAVALPDKPPAPPALTIQCAICGQTAHPRRKDTKYCGPKCKSRAEYLSKMERDPDLNRKKYAKRTPEQQAKYLENRKRKLNQHRPTPMAK